MEIENMAKIEHLAEIMVKSKSTVVLTGAGISTESGIPDFRSPGTGLWEKIDPMKALSTDALYRNPERFYKEGFQLLMDVQGYEPNVGHKVVADLEEKGFIDAVITQNIDGLHTKAGSKIVLEVHGTVYTGHCERCGKIYNMADLDLKRKSGQVPPKCFCGGILRPDVVMFGDQLPGCFNDALQYVKESEILLVIGSSLTVYPVAALAGYTENLVIINKTPTPFDSKAKMVIRGSAGHILTSLRGKIFEKN